MRNFADVYTFNTAVLVYLETQFGRYSKVVYLFKYDSLLTDRTSYFFIAANKMLCVTIVMLFFAHHAAAADGRLYVFTEGLDLYNIIPIPLFSPTRTAESLAAGSLSRSLQEVILA